MKLFLDTEFTGLHQNTTLISLGLISEDNKSFYAEFTDFDLKQVENDDWLKENVMKNLLYFDLNDIEEWEKEKHSTRQNNIANVRGKLFDPAYDNTDNIRMFGNTLGIKSELEKWLNQFSCKRDRNGDGNCDIHPERFNGCPKLEIWSDCLSYDWVLFNNIFGHAFNIPNNINYIPFDICTMFKILGINPDINREELVSKNLNKCNFDKKGFFLNLAKGKHNALWDSFIIKCCYEILESINKEKQHFIDTAKGLYCIDQNPKNVSHDWIIKNNFKL